MPSRTFVLRRRRPALVVGLFALAASMLLPAGANAALTLDAGYASTANQGCNSMGQADGNGVMYTVCGTAVRRYDSNGTRLADVNLTGAASTSDVAPSPDGSILYVPQGTNPVVRFVRNAVGVYVKDANWKLATVPAGGKNWTPVGSDIYTDGRGDIYFSTGSNWVSNSVATIEVIAKFQPDGTYITAFGEHGTDAGQWNANQDVVASRDGRRVYVSENCGVQCIDTKGGYQPSRIFRWDYVVGAGTYTFTKVISAQGATNGHPYPYCEDAGAVHSAYSIAMDYAENLYATSTTCGRLQVFATNADPAKDKFVKSIAINTDANANGVRNHYIGSDWEGRIFANEWSLRITPKAPPAIAYPLRTPAALPLPDTTAPTLTSVTMPASTTTRQVPVRIVAADNTAVSELRLANEDGAWGPWQPFVSPVTHTLTANYATKGVSVQVRDMAGNESTSVYRTISYAAVAAGDGGGVANPNPGGPADVAVPVVASVTIPAITVSRDITVTTQATDDVAVTGIRIANEDGTWSAWKAFKAATPWTLSAGNTNKLIFVQVRDAVGNESTAITARTRVSADAPVGEVPPGAANDTVAPVLTKFTLPDTTTTQTLTTTLAATDAVGVAQVRFANEDGNWGAWTAYRTNAPWTLTPGYMNKVVTAQVRDAAGNESLTLTARTSYVKTAPAPGAAVDAADPTLTAVTIPATVPTAVITVRLTAADDVGVTQVRFANEDGEWQDWKAFGVNVPHTLTAGNTNKLVFAQVRDAAGKESNVLYTRTLVQP